MSLRTLLGLALVLGLLLAGVVYIGLDRAGFFAEWESADFVFRNHLLDVPQGAFVRLRPMQAKTGEYRYLFGSKVVEPVLVRDRPLTPGVDPPPLPYVRVWMGRRRPDMEDWSFAGWQFPLFGLMGARSPKEWIEEIRLVHERGDDGSRRPLIRALFGHESNSRVAYFYDPADPDPVARGFGWVRTETYADRQVSDVFFTSPDGRFDAR